MEDPELPKSTIFNAADIIDYSTNNVIVKNILRKPTGSIKLTALDSGRILKEETSSFDTFIQIIEGKAEIFIDNKSSILEPGQFIIVPAHLPNYIKANEKFIMLTVIIKSGYEEVA